MYDNTNDNTLVADTVMPIHQEIGERTLSEF